MNTISKLFMNTQTNKWYLLTIQADGKQCVPNIKQRGDMTWVVMSSGIMTAVKNQYRENYKIFNTRNEALKYAEKLTRTKIKNGYTERPIELMNWNSWT